MTPQQRLTHARAEIQQRLQVARSATPGPWWWTSRRLTSDTADITETEVDCIAHCYGGTGKVIVEQADREHIAGNDPSHVAAVLELHDQILQRVDPWLLARLGRPGLLSQLVTGLLDLYAPLEPPQTAAHQHHQTQEARG